MTAAGGISGFQAPLLKSRAAALPIYPGPCADNGTERWPWRDGPLLCGQFLEVASHQPASVSFSAHQALTLAELFHIYTTMPLPSLPLNQVAGD